MFQMYCFQTSDHHQMPSAKLNLINLTVFLWLKERNMFFFTQMADCANRIEWTYTSENVSSKRHQIFLLLILNCIPIVTLNEPCGLSIEIRVFFCMTLLAIAASNHEAYSGQEVWEEILLALTILVLSTYL